MEEKKVDNKENLGEHWHAPDTLFCHAKFSKKECTNKECKFKHELYYPKRFGGTKVPEKICPNGVKCPINHRKIKCPIEKDNGVC